MNFLDHLIALFWIMLISTASEDSNDKRYYGNYARPYYGVYSYPKGKDNTILGRPFSDSYKYGKSQGKTAYDRPYYDSYRKPYYDSFYDYGNSYYGRNSYGKPYADNIYDKLYNGYDRSYSNINYNNPYRGNNYGNPRDENNGFNGNSEYTKPRYPGNAYDRSYYENNDQNKRLYNYVPERPQNNGYGRTSYGYNRILILRPHYEAIDTVYHP